MHKHLCVRVRNRTTKVYLSLPISFRFCKSLTSPISNHSYFAKLANCLNLQTYVYNHRVFSVCLLCCLYVMICLLLVVPYISVCLLVWQVLSHTNTSSLSEMTVWPFYTCSTDKLITFSVGSSWAVTSFHRLKCTREPSRYQFLNMELVQASSLPKS